MINYHSKFIPNISTIAAPLNWHGNEVLYSISKSQREALESTCWGYSTVHYDPKLPVKLDCDVLSMGIGVVLSHVFTENYSHTEQEALSIVWGILSTYLSVYLQKFTLVMHRSNMQVQVMRTIGEESGDLNVKITILLIDLQKKCPPMRQFY